MNDRRLHGFRCAILCSILATSVIFPHHLEAAAPWAEPLPWEALDNDPGFTFGFQRFDDTASDWQVDAFTLMSVMPQGASNRFYLRWRHLNVHTADAPLFTRWPEAAPPLEEDEVADSDWPGEKGIAGWGRPELGLLAPIELPLLGSSVFCGEVALPFARNDLYPYSSRSISLRFGLQRSVSLRENLILALRAERILNMEAAGEDLSGDAFPARTAWGGGLDWRFAAAGVLRLEARTTTDTEASRLRLMLQLPLGKDRRLALGVMRSLADEADRLFETRFSAMVTVAMPGLPNSDPVPEDIPAMPQEAQ